MGKVTIIVQTPNLSSSEIEQRCHKYFDMSEPILDTHNEYIEDVDVFIVPADEEYPDLG